MRKSALWCLPCAFFLVAVVLNLIGSVRGTALADAVKPALLPLLTATTLAYLVGKDVPDLRLAGLLVAAQLFGGMGDVLLISNSALFNFAGGMAAFLIGHIFYMALFGGQSWRGLSVWAWLIAIAIMAVTVFVPVKAIGITGPLKVPMIIYAFGLTFLIFSALAGVLRMPEGRRTTWWILLAGTLLFTLSDACLAMIIFDVMSFALRDLVVMITYLAAQSLLAFGGVRLILGK